MSIKNSAFLMGALLLDPAASHAATKSLPDPDPTVPVYMAKGFPDTKLEGTQYALPNSWYGLSAPKPGDKELSALLTSLGLPAKVGKTDGKRPETAPHLFDTDLRAYLPTINPSYLAGDPPATKHFELTPAVSYFFKSDTDFAIDCEFRADLIDGGKSTWQARYRVNRDATLSAKDPEVATTLESAFRDCFQIVGSMFALHRAKRELLFRPAHLTKGIEAVTRPTVWAYYPERIIYLDEEGMVDEDTSHFTDTKMD